MKKIALILTILMFSSLFVSPTYSYTVSEGGSKQISKSSVIEVYEGDSLDKSFIVLGKINVKAGTPSMLMQATKRKALRKGGDAVLMYKINNSGKMSYWSGAQISYAEGVVVKYQEQGIRKITSDTKMPVID